MTRPDLTSQAFKRSPHALLAQQVEAFGQCIGRPAQFAQNQLEVIGAVRAASQFTLVRAQCQYPHVARRLQPVPVWRRAARQAHAEPLAGQGTAIFQAAIADIPKRHAADLGEAFGELGCIQIALFQQEIGMLAIP